MNSLHDHPITRKWPARHPDRLQLYSLPTPNGVKVSIALEELGLPYEAHRVSFDTQDQLSPEFLSLNPNNKIPAILDPDGPGGQPLALWESGAILLYLADKTGRLLPAQAAARWHALQWLMWQMGGLGPMFGQLGFFHKFAGKDWCWAATTASPISPSSPGCATWWVFTRRASWSASSALSRCGACWTPSSPARRCSAACKSRRGDLRGAAAAPGRSGTA